MKFQKESFKNESIVLDFNEYIECSFKECDIMYSGSGSTILNGCTFDNVRWGFTGSAANTLNFMQAMYHGGAFGGRSVIEETFENIRKGVLPQLPS